MSKQEQLDNATRLFDLAKSKTMPKSFLNLLLNQVLDLGPEVGVYSKDHFREFLDMNDKILPCFIASKKIESKPGMLSNSGDGLSSNSGGGLFSNSGGGLFSNSGGGFESKGGGLFSNSGRPPQNLKKSTNWNQYLGKN